VKRLLPLVLVLASACSHPRAALTEGAGDPATGGAPSSTDAPATAAPDAPAAADAQAAPTPAPPASSGTPRPPRRGGPKVDVKGIRAATEAVLRAQTEGYWRLFTRGDPVDPAVAWTGHESLLSDDTLAGLAAAHDAAAGEERRALGHLRAWLVGERLARDAAEPARAGGARPAATFEWDGRAVPLREAAGLLAGEHDADRRRALAEAAAAGRRPLAAAAAEREGRLRVAALGLGYASTLELAAEVRGQSPEALGALAEATLARTDAIWARVLGELARREKLAPEDVRARDLPRLLRTGVSAAAFPGDRQLDAAAALLAALGIDLAGQRNLHLDPAARAGKVPLAITLPLDPPADVRLSTAPVAGLDALRGVLHELGVAEAYAHVRGGGPVELRRLGPAALHQAWGILLEEVGGAPEWLVERGVEDDRARSEARVAAARRLLRAREAAARVLAAIARVRAPDDAAAEEVRLVARARGCPADVDPFPPQEPDPLLRTAETLRAELLAAQAEVFLATKGGGAAWWRSRVAGSWLVGAWADGSRRTPDELSRAMGQQGLGPAALEALVRERAGL
jgi:hypothetical protein